MTRPTGAYADISIQRGGSTIAHGTATAGTVAVLVAANLNRVEVIIHNNGSSTDTVFIGAAAVAADNGVKLAAGEKVTIQTTAAVYLVAETGTPTVSYLEVTA